MHSKICPKAKQNSLQRLRYSATSILQTQKPTNKQVLAILEAFFRAKNVNTLVLPSDGIEHNQFHSPILERKGLKALAQSPKHHMAVLTPKLTNIHSDPINHIDLTFHINRIKIRLRIHSGKHRRNHEQMLNPVVVQGFYLTPTYNRAAGFLTGGKMFQQQLGKYRL